MLMEWRSNCTEVCTVCVAQFATYIPCRVIVGGSVWVRGGLQHPTHTQNIPGLDSSWGSPLSSKELSPVILTEDGAGKRSDNIREKDRVFGEPLVEKQWERVGKNLRFNCSSESLQETGPPYDQTRLQQCNMLMEWRSNCTEVCTVGVAQFATNIPCRVIVGGSAWVRAISQQRLIQHTPKNSTIASGWIGATIILCQYVRCQVWSLTHFTQTRKIDNTICPHNFPHFKVSFGTCEAKSSTGKVA